MTKPHVPSLYEWMGSSTASFENLIEVFYNYAIADPLLASLFEDMPQQHRKHVALWFAEVFGGPKTYSTMLGGHAHMVKNHLNLGISEPQRSCWCQLMLRAADEVGLPTDPEFRSAFVAYVEWGTRMALMYSQPDQQPPSDSSPMPTWGWGEVQPYMPATKEQQGDS
jgi:hemoglobin